MKKIVSIIIVIVSLLLIGTIFLSTNKKIDLVESNLEIANPKDLKLEVIENTNTSLRWKVINNTGKEVTTSYEFFIEKYKDGKWYSYQVIANFNEIGINIQDEHTDAVDFEMIYGNLEKGKYRFIKNIDGTFGSQYERGDIDVVLNYIPPTVVGSRTLVSIAITTPPTQVNYATGDYFDSNLFDEDHIEEEIAGEW